MRRAACTHVPAGVYERPLQQLIPRRPPPTTSLATTMRNPQPCMHPPHGGARRLGHHRVRATRGAARRGAPRRGPRRAAAAPSADRRGAPARRVRRSPRRRRHGRCWRRGTLRVRRGRRPWHARGRRRRRRRRSSLPTRANAAPAVRADARRSPRGNCGACASCRRRGRCEGVVSGRAEALLLAPPNLPPRGIARCAAAVRRQGLRRRDDARAGDPRRRAGAALAVRGAGRPVEPASTTCELDVRSVVTAAADGELMHRRRQRYASAATTAAKITEDSHRGPGWSWTRRERPRTNHRTLRASRQ